MFHKEGTKIIFISAVITMGLFFLIDALVSIDLSIVLEIIVLMFFLLILQFFRQSLLDSLFLIGIPLQSLNLQYFEMKVASSDHPPLVRYVDNLRAATRHEFAYEVTEDYVMTYIVGEKE